VRMVVDAEGLVTMNNTVHALMLPMETQPRHGLNTRVHETMASLLEAESRAAGWDGTRGSVSPLELRIVGKGDAPFIAALGCLQAGAMAGVGVCTFVLWGEDSEGFRYWLPRDQGISVPNPAQEKSGAFKVRLLHTDGVTTATVRRPGTKEALEGELRVEAPFWPALASTIASRRESLRPKHRLIVEISLVPRDIARIRFDDVRRLLTALRAGGVDDILFEGPINAPRRR
jgi:hypothetical protein